MRAGRDTLGSEQRWARSGGWRALAAFALLAASGLGLACGGGDGDPEPTADRGSGGPTQAGSGSTPEPTPNATDQPGESQGAGTLASSLSGFIAFTSERDGTDDIYIMAADGSNVRKLTETDQNEWWPAVSPDGRTLVFGRSYEDRLSSMTDLRPYGIFAVETGGAPSRPDAQQRVELDAHMVTRRDADSLQFG